MSRSPHALALTIALTSALVTLTSAPAGADPAAIDAILAKLPKTARVGIVVEDGESGRVLYERNADTPLRPASNQKLVTLAAAILGLGPDYRHRTELRAAGPVAGNRLFGDLHLIGGGDPNLSRRFQDPSQPASDVPILIEWAQTLLRRGIREIRGDLVADDRFFDRELWHPDWEKADHAKWYAAEVSALNLNDNCVDIEFHAGAKPRVQLIPPTGWLEVSSDLSATSDRKKHVYGVSRSFGSNAVTVRGRLWTGAGVGRTEITVHDPALFFATALKESLARAGIRLTGKVRRVKDGEQAKGELLACHESPLPLTLSICGKRSLNLYAECLLKTLGRETAGEGSWKAGAKAVTAVLDKAGATMPKAVIADGSGLCRANRLTARGLTRLLAVMARSPHDNLYRSCLAAGGIDGTLRRRFRKLPAGCRVEAKTGTLRDTSALSGYLIKPGKTAPLRFAILMNDTPGARRLQDRIVAALLK